MKKLAFHFVGIFGWQRQVINESYCILLVQGKSQVIWSESKSQTIHNE
jgi:hypothetical protein